MFTHKCVDHETCSFACSRTKRTHVCTLFWLTKSCLRITFNIWHHVCPQIFNRRSRDDVQPHDLTYEPFSVSNFPHMKSCLRTLVWPTRRTVKKRPFAQLFDLHGCVCMKIFSWDYVSVYNLLDNFICLCSTDMFPHSVSTTRRFHTLKYGCLHTFWVTNSFLCVTLNIWHRVWHQISHRQVETMYNRTTF